jgi:iron(III) transport system substrate-binding protein
VCPGACRIDSVAATAARFRRQRQPDAATQAAQGCTAVTRETTMPRHGQTRRDLLKLASAAALTVPAMPRGAAAQGLPSYYPPDYGKIVEASKQENSLLVYSVLAQYNWAPVLADFNKLYPWIKVSTLDLAGEEVFQRYYADRGSGSQTGGMLLSTSVETWMDFAKRGNLVPYRSPEDAKLPDWSRPVPGMYTVSADPLVMVYNKLLLPEDKRPRGLKHLAELVKANPGLFRNAVTSYDPMNATAPRDLYLIYENKLGDQLWQWMEAIAPVLRPETSAGPMLQKLGAGEYKVAYFASGVVVFPRMKDAAMQKVMDWRFMEDGQPLWIRPVGIPKDGSTPNAARLMLDFIVSRDGQAAFGRGGLTPYRSDVRKDEVAAFTLDSIAEAVGGQQNLMVVGFDPDLRARADAFAPRWKQLMQKK